MYPATPEELIDLGHTRAARGELPQLLMADVPDANGIILPSL